LKTNATVINVAPAAEKGMVAVLAELVKARLTSLVLLTTLVGFHAGCTGEMSHALLFHTLLGTGLLAAGAAALNQYLEREHDARMARTEHRPLPTGRLSATAAVLFGGAASCVGLLWLAAAVNLLTSLLGALTLVSYLFLYTPLKRVTTLNTAIGAVPGALPPLMGWTAARDEISLGGWSLFAILFFWQLPHFLAIGWLHRDDYARAGYIMLPAVDREGGRTGSQAVSHTLGLLTVSLTPSLIGLTGVVYFSAALLLGCVFLWFAIRFSRRLTPRAARQLFLASILYLPLLLAVLALDRLRL
jgi:protoheme IX farnesyltransferase